MPRLLFAVGILAPLGACNGSLLPSVQVGKDAGGSTYGIDTLPFELRRADGRVLAGNASVRVLRVEFATRDASGQVVCSGGFLLNSEHAPVAITAECADVGFLHGTADEAYADHGAGTLTEAGGRHATFRYGASLR